MTVRPKLFKPVFIIITIYLTTFGVFHCYSTPADHPEKFQHPPITSSLNCAEILEEVNNDTDTINANRIAYKDEEPLPVDCDSIVKRNYFSTSSVSNEEKDFPIAYARAIFRDYMYIESELAATYAPQNWYCFAMDAKSNQVFHSRVRALASCFPNVLVTKKEWSMDSSGHNMTNSLHECMKELSKPEMKWNYLILLQNHDIALKTNEELVQIFKWFDGANDSEIKKPLTGRINYTLDWSFENLKLLRNANHIKSGHPQQLQFSKSLVEISLSRPTVDFIVHELDLTIMIEQFDTTSYGVDEFAFPTLLTTEAIDIPGGYTHALLDKGIETLHVTRLSVWGDENCTTNHIRHWSCIFGVEDLSLRFKNSTYLFANKVLPEFDVGAINCWHEELFNRTYFKRGKHRLHKNVYTQLPLVRYHAEKRKNGSVDVECHAFSVLFNFSIAWKAFHSLPFLFWFFYHYITGIKLD
ncbi:core-2/I-Branching enzyme domain-containing protein [Ditylenchus destructor]|nr:core-2/I-Branching enzyme domain-containing protein [Ditylenchus destructor]